MAEDTQNMIYRAPKQIEHLAQEIRLLVDEYVRVTGLKPEWIGFTYTPDTTVSILFQQFDYVEQDYRFNGTEPGPGGELPPETPEL